MLLHAINENTENKQDLIVFTLEISKKELKSYQQSTGTLTSKKRTCPITGFMSDKQYKEWSN